ncbi:hypothetical protein BU24DRAFT_409805 [Aaosphaeria arxii CBS 175.79]|uniref:Uncharacterized protein n=1 Tax=Aaosphaeria arxii CBS 175.79 TaxID=1450172 RepID=A0A6A5XU57_9PLEO|nr:uncharacterized protein BU24DRAFT_409805 [Aaosphaeria arxii CBS 175.79]KAF2016732.1 hypothetical protein BU24DRAFT_409805 [Aaosphaeria arxii CBS 175.79]
MNATVRRRYTERIRAQRTADNGPVGDDERWMSGSKPLLASHDPRLAIHKVAILPIHMQSQGPKQGPLGRRATAREDDDKPCRGLEIRPVKAKVTASNRGKELMQRIRHMYTIVHMYDARGSRRFEKDSQDMGKSRCKLIAAEHKKHGASQCAGQEMDQASAGEPRRRNYQLMLAV